MDENIDFNDRVRGLPFDRSKSNTDARFPMPLLLVAYAFTRDRAFSFSRRSA
jgi:hypothetical protein